MTLSINDVCDFIIVKVAGDEAAPLNLLKLQKLVYYAQAWHLAIHDKPLFEGRFQAWVHGPLNRALFDRFAAQKTLYSAVDTSDIQADFDMNRVPVESQRFLDTVLDEYAGLTGSQLEEMTHNEQPWIEARQGYRPSQRCEKEISQETMRRFYRQRMTSQAA